MFNIGISAEYFLAYKENEIVGRIAAIVNWVEVKEQKKNKLRFGWYDVIDDFEVSKKLIESVIEFGRKRKLSFMEGPVGFSNLDKAGMLIKGFEENNTMITWYNAPYYYDHFKKLGFKDLAVWVEYEIMLSSFEESPEKIKKFSNLMLERYELNVLDFKSKKDIIPYIEEMFLLLEETYGKLQTFVPIQKYQINQYKKKYFRYIHPDFIKCVVDKNNDLVAFTIIMPSFTRALKKANGKMYPCLLYTSPSPRDS